VHVRVEVLEVVVLVKLMRVGLKVQAIPVAGVVEFVKVTVPVNPLTLVTLIVEYAGVSIWTVTAVGLAATEKPIEGA